MAQHHVRAEKRPYRMKGRAASRRRRGSGSPRVRSSFTRRWGHRRRRWPRWPSTPACTAPRSTATSRTRRRSSPRAARTGMRANPRRTGPVERHRRTRRTAPPRARTELYAWYRRTETMIEVADPGRDHRAGRRGAVRRVSRSAGGGARHPARRPCTPRPQARQRQRADPTCAEVRDLAGAVPRKWSRGSAGCGADGDLGRRRRLGAALSGRVAAPARRARASIRLTQDCSRHQAPAREAQDVAVAGVAAGHPEALITWNPPDDRDEVENHPEDPSQRSSIPAAGRPTCSSTKRSSASCTTGVVTSSAVNSVSSETSRNPPATILPSSR